MCPKFNMYNSILLCFVCALFCVRLSEQYTMRSSTNTNIEECKTWNEALYKCQECNAGFVGTNCDIYCRYPSYGNNCQSQCNCLEINCHPATGCKDGSTIFSSPTLTSSVKKNSSEFFTTNKLECPAGYIGKECNIRCRYPAFGHLCQFECKCSEERCNFAKGCSGLSIPSSSNNGSKNSFCKRAPGHEGSTALLYHVTVSLIVLAAVFLISYLGLTIHQCLFRNKFVVK